MKDHNCPNTLERVECPQCKEEIDPETCHCGQDKNGHDSETHPFIPIGCHCFYAN